MSTRLLPTNVQHIGSELAISWNDGSETFLSLEGLRRACPCAACGGEPDILGNVDRPDVHYTQESFILRSFQLIGGYALQPTWADGHGSGLFTYQFLHQVGSLQDDSV